MHRATTLAALSLLVALPASAQPEAAGTRVEVRGAGYADDNETYVLRPYVAGRLAAGPMRFGAAYSPDVVTSASVDVVASASRGMEEVRHQAMADAAFVGDEGLLVGGAYTMGLEPDHETHGGQLRIQRDLDPERLWHGGIVLGASWARIGSVIDPHLRAESLMVQGSAVLSRIFAAQTVGRLSLEGSVTDGFQASPYRTVRLGDWTAQRGDPTDPDSPVWVFTGVTGVVRERHPTLRMRARLGVELAHDLGGDLAILGRVAGYADDWGIFAGDLSAELRVEPEQNLVVRVGARVYLQSGTSFWRHRYQSTDDGDAYVTGDRELGPMRSYTLLAGISVPIDEIRLDARVEGVRYEYPEFDLLPERHALSVMLGCTWAPDFSL